MTARPIRFTALANLRGAPGLTPAPMALAARAAEIETTGFDSLSYAELLIGDVFAPLMLLAANTQRAQLLTRVAGAFSRSPVLLASGAAWVSEMSGGRFALGIGASVPHEAHEYLGVVFDQPAARMRDTITIIRALWGEDLPGVTRDSRRRVRYHGPCVQVDTASIDFIPAQRPPIYLAAAGPLMLRLAGELADGVILELTTPQYVRWAKEQIAIGAAKAGRSLDDIDICMQGTWIFDATPDGATTRSGQYDFHITHCVDKEFHALWERGGIGDEARQVREAMLRGDRAEAERLVETVLWPTFAVRTSQIDTFWRWLDDHVAAGVTLFALPANVEQVLGVSLAEIRARANARRESATTR